MSGDRRRASAEFGHPVAGVGYGYSTASSTGSVAGGLRKVQVLLGAVACGSVFLAALPAGHAGDPRPRSPSVASGVGAPIAWGPCEPAGPRLQCARIRVPLDWDRPNGRTIQLALIRHLSSKPGQRIGSMLINPGGPGDTGVGLVRGGGAELDTWGDGRFDVVSWDPRGTNASTHVRCFRSTSAERKFWQGTSIPISKAASERYRRKTVALARRCGEVSGWLLPHISTADTARDLDHIRRLVGDHKLTYVGLSYGTYLGQTYANMFPGRVRAMLLDAVVDAVAYSRGFESYLANGVSGADPVFARLLSLCERAGPQRCALAGHARTPAERVDRLFARLRRAPIPAPSASPPGKLTYSDLLLAQFNPLRLPETWPQVAKNLDAAVRGDGSALATEARTLLTPVGFAGATTSAAVSCADTPAQQGSRRWPRVIGRFSRISRLYGPVLGWWLWAPCASWPVRGQDNYRGPWNATTRNRILVIGTRNDPATAYTNAVRVARRLGNAVLLTHAGYGHVSFQDPSACIDRARIAYLVRLNTPPKGTVCNSDREPFDPDFGSPLTGHTHDKSP
jgi:pimeloyl-ACP methyl ester carboxylesterase